MFNKLLSKTHNSRKKDELLSSECMRYYRKEIMMNKIKEENSKK